MKAFGAVFTLSVFLTFATTGVVLADPIEILNNGDKGNITTISGVTALLEGASKSSGIGSSVSFLDLKHKGSSGVQAGYNTDGSLEFNTQTAESLLLSSLASLDVNGVFHYEFGLSNNQTGSDKTISIEELQFFQSSANDLSGYDTSTRTLSGADLIFDWIAPDGGHILLNDINGGASKIDMLMFVPTSIFSARDYVYFFASMGGNNPANGGEERWTYFGGFADLGVFTEEETLTPVPEPGTFFLLCSGLLGLALCCYRKRKSNR